MSIEINYIFSIGWRCSSTLFLEQLGLRSFSSPFDHMFCDLESSLKLIKKSMDGFLENIIMIKQDENAIELVKSNTLTSVPNSYQELNKNEIFWSYKSWKDHRLFLNVDYNPRGSLPQDVNEWDPIWIMIHHDLRENEVRETFLRRVTRFTKIIEKFPDKTMLFFLSKVLSFSTVESFKEKYMTLLDTYLPDQYCCLVLCSDQLEKNEHLFYKDKYLLLFKKVPSLKEQQKIGLTENDTDKVNFSEEIELIHKYFKLDII